MNHASTHLPAPHRLWGMPAAVLLCLAATIVQAEPYLAVYKGMQCAACHSHSAGGGKRNAYGNVFAQSELAEKRIGPADAEFWTGEINRWLAVGANLRGRFDVVDVSGTDATNEFRVERGTVYVEANVIPNRLSMYVDQQVAPSASQNREAYVKIRSASGRYQLTAGQFYLPYGLRLQDDTAFVRQVTGINFTNPDRGVQLGYESGPWSAQASLTNGTGGGSEIDSGKQLSGVVNYVRPRWRVGASVNVNNADAGDRQMGNLFAGLRTGPIVWLGEIDLIRDEVQGQPDVDGIAGLIEGNWLFRKGHNLKIGYDYFDPSRDIDEDHQVRYRVAWEYSPMQFIQARIGVRVYDGPPQFPAANREQVFAELHGFF